MENDGVCSFDFTVNAFNNHLAYELTNGAHEARHYFTERLNSCVPNVMAHMPEGVKQNLVKDDLEKITLQKEDAQSESELEELEKQEEEIIKENPEEIVNIVNDIVEENDVEIDGKKVDKIEDLNDTDIIKEIIE